MKSLAFLLGFAFLMLSAFGQKIKAKKVEPDSTKPVQIVEAACGECQLGLAGSSCDLAVRIDGKAYFVDGTKIDDHGDAHAKEGFCNSVRKAAVQGEIVDDRFKVTYFKFIPTKKKKGKGKTDKRF